MNRCVIMQGAKGSREEVNQLMFQPFLTYNLLSLPDGWYPASAPVVTADWETSSDGRWVVPLGGSFGKLFARRRQRMRVNHEAYGNVVKTKPSASLRSAVMACRSKLTISSPYVPWCGPERRS
jgi:hypothetical protein